MGEMLVPNDGMRGVNIETPDGKKVSLDADRSGKVKIESPQLQRALKAEGFTMAAGISGFAAKAYPCAGCNFQSLFMAYKCWKCGVENDYRD